jgi:hypothetical protein
LRHEEPTVSITRRRLLAATAAVCAGAAGTAYWGLHDDDEEDPGDLLEAATDLLGDADGAPWLGSAYLRAHPDIATEKQVTRRILAGARGRPSTAAELRQVIHRDYAAGRTVVLEGWYFAESEAAAAALLALNA